MKAYDLYGTSSGTPLEIMDALRALLEVDFEERESSYWGIYYVGGNRDGEHFRILDNVHDDPDELPYDEFAEVPVVLEVNATERADELGVLLAGVPGLSLLRRTQR